jgi:predicted ArsR family transcriptional regulator
MSDSFAAAVDAFRDAVTRFDCPRGLYADSDPRWPEDPEPLFGGVWLDYDAIREPSVIAEELEQERRFGATTRAQGGGGERRGQANPMARDVPSLKPRPYRRSNASAQGEAVADALRRLSKGTEREIGAAAGVSRNTVAMRLRRMERDGTAKRAGGGETKGKGGGRTPLTWEAAAGPREVEEMPKGVKFTDEGILAVLAVAKTARSVAEVAAKAGCSEETAGDVLRRLEKAGKVTWARGLGRGGPKVWRLFDVPPETGKTPCVSARVEIEAKVAHASAPVPVGQVSSQRSLADLLEREVVREAKRRAAAILNDVAHQLMVEAEAAGGGA